MKGGILTLLWVLVFGWTSCSNEEPIPGTEEGEDMTLTVDFQSAENMQTKAAGNDKVISNRFIAAFKVKEDGTKVCTGIASDNNNAPLQIKAKTGDVTFIAIANANEVPGLRAIIASSTLPTYANLKALTTDFLETPKTTLIKVAEDTRTGLTFDDTNRKFVFRLHQLQAQVTLKVLVGDGKGTFVANAYQIDGINQRSDVVLSDTTQVRNKSFVAAATLANGTNPTFFTYERLTDAPNLNAPLTMSVSGTLTIGGKAVLKSYKMNINPTISNGGTTGVVHGWAYTVEGTISVQDPSTLTVTIKAKPWQDCEVDVSYGDSDEM